MKSHIKYSLCRRSFDDPSGGPYGCDATRYHILALTLLPLSSNQSPCTRAYVHHRAISGNMTISDVLVTDTTSATPGPWGPDHNASVTIRVRISLCSDHFQGYGGVIDWVINFGWH